MMPTSVLAGTRSNQERKACTMTEAFIELSEVEFDEQ